MLLFFSSACRFLYGIKERAFDEEEIAQFAASFEPDESIILKDNLYSLYYYAIDSCSDSATVKNLFQPLQVHYFDADLNYLAGHINCYAQPTLTKLNWSAHGKLAQFPPNSDIDPKNCMAGLKLLLKPYPLKTEEKYYVLIFWNLWMKKQSKHLIHTVKKYMADKNYKLLLINNDILYALED